MNEKPVKLMWTTTAMGGRSSLPIPGERPNNDFSGPPSLFWSPWLELGAANQIPVFNSVFTQNYQSVLSAHIAVNKNQVTAAIHFKYFLTVFPSFLNEIPE